MRDIDKKISTGGGVSFGGMLGIMFIVLKLCNVISWSWVWVLAPIWIEVGIGVILGFFLILYYERN